MKAVYEQSTKNHELEYRLVQLTTIREAYLEDFRILEREIFEKRRKFDDECILDGMKLLNNVRESTFDFLEQVAAWQRMLVKSKRPTIMNCDYLTEMIRSTEFINSSPIRKHFNFAVMRRNIFMLPLSTGKPRDAVLATKEILKEIDKFANPNIDRLIQSYRLFQKSFPAKVFQSLMPLDRWANNLWQPNVELYPRLPPISTQPPSPAVRHGSVGNIFQRPRSSSGGAGPAAHKRKQSTGRHVGTLVLSSGGAEAAVKGAPSASGLSQSGVLDPTDPAKDGGGAEAARTEPGDRQGTPTGRLRLLSKQAEREGEGAAANDEQRASIGHLATHSTASSDPPRESHKTSLAVDTAVGGLGGGPPSPAEGLVATDLAPVSAVSSPGLSKATAKEIKISHAQASPHKKSPAKGLAEPSRASTLGSLDTPAAGGLLSTAQLREWYQTNAPQREDSDDD